MDVGHDPYGGAMSVELPVFGVLPSEITANITVGQLRIKAKFPSTAHPSTRIYLPTRIRRASPQRPPTHPTTLHRTSSDTATDNPLHPPEIDHPPPDESGEGDGMIVLDGNVPSRTATGLAKIFGRKNARELAGEGAEF